MSKNNLLGGDENHAYTFGRLDAALGEHPMRFVNNNPELRSHYMRGFNDVTAKVETTCTIKEEFRNEFPWHKSNGTVEEIDANAAHA